MIEERALVREINGAEVLVEVRRNSTCGTCSLEKGCGVGSLGRLLGLRATTYSIPNNQQLKKGDNIVIGLAEQAYLKAGMMVYLMPLVSLFMFSFLADWFFGGSELWNVLAAISGLFAGLWIARHLSSGRLGEQFQARFLRREFID